MTALLPEWLLEEGYANQTGCCFTVKMQGLTEWGEAKLSTDNVGIQSVPSIITDGTPDTIVAEFNTAFADVSSTNQSDISISTGYMGKGKNEILAVFVKILKNN